MGVVHRVVVGGGQRVESEGAHILKHLRRGAEPAAAADRRAEGLVPVHGGLQVQEAEIAAADEIPQRAEAGILPGQAAEHHRVARGCQTHHTHMIHALLSVLIPSDVQDIHKCGADFSFWQRGAEGGDAARR